ncbi:HNH endonuclease signature motif containing protein [Microbacterium oleivorans]|nr:HNH endonuclease signature motif containing protein [Microbacterium oleivorans]
MQANNEAEAMAGGSPHAAAFAGFDESLRLLHAGEVAAMRALAELGRSALREAHRGGVRGMASDMELRSVAAEAAGIARRGDRRVQWEIDHAMTVVDEYPAMFAAWEQRLVTREHVDVVVKVGRAVPEEVRPEFDAAAVAVCQRDIATRVAGALQNLAERMHPRSFSERHREAAAGRCVRLSPGVDGMADLSATVPMVIAAGIYDRLTQMAQSVKDARADAVGADAGAVDAARDGAATAPDTRTMDQLRADVLSDLVLGGAPVVDPTTGTDGRGTLGAIRAKVQVVITADTLTGKDEHPAEATGTGLIDADTVRELASQTGTWDRMFIDPITRTPVETDAYRPLPAMRRLLQTRDQHCRFPGCRRAAIRCEIDHTIDHATGGHTHILNLAHLCQRHHSMKQFTTWRVKQIGGGVLVWTSPHGRVYREDVPIPTVCFTPELATPPPPGPPRPPRPPGPPGRGAGAPPDAPPPF